MRTTVTLDDDVADLLRQRIRDRRVSFKDAVNEAVRIAYGAPPGRSRGFRTETASMGESDVNLDRALQVVAELEDDDLIRRMRSGS